ncbi:MAG TPA: glycosyl hydrolase, partial [bacterium]|nr:glycosyl hydrolase [bacterium]
MGKNLKRILDEFKSPGSSYRGAPFWAWNGKLEPQELRRQVRLMHEMGLGGFFMHSRVGLDTEYLSKEWFDCINACADEAEKHNMLAYLYDEDRWPSGFAGGLVTKNPEYRIRYLCLKILKNTAKLQWKKNVIAVFAAEFEGTFLKYYTRIKKGKRIQTTKTARILVFSVEMGEPSNWYNGYTYLDTMNHKAVREFIRITHDQYKRYNGKYFGKVIPGIFTDEPNYGSQFFHYVWPPQPEGNIAVSWTDKLPDVFKKRYGYDILNHLPEIYFDVEGGEISKPRYHYMDCITYLFTDAFAKQIGDWCEKNHILFTGHVLAEDNLRTQTNVVGNAMRFYQYMQAPGMDLLTEHWRIFNTAKQVSSVARQFGRKWRLTETYGCTGWDFPFSGHKALGDWQTALGINLRCQHLSWYTMLGEAKRDYPASIFYQSPWWQTYKKVEDYFARIYSVMTEGIEVRDLLVIHPIESMWTIFKMPSWDAEKNIWERPKQCEKYDEMFTTLCDYLLSSHIDFDYGDEDILAKWTTIKKKDGSVVLRVNKAEYKAVLVPPLYTIRSSTIEILKRFKDAGGRVVFVEKTPGYMDAETKVNLSDKFHIAANLQTAVKEIEPVTRRVSIVDENNNQIQQILYLLREDDNAYYLFLCNTAMEWNKNIFGPHTISSERSIEFNNVTISGCPEWKYPIFELNPDTGKILFAETIKNEKNGYAIKTSFPALQSRLYIIPKKGIPMRVCHKEKLQEIEKNPIQKDAWTFQLSERNVFV